MNSYRRGLRNGVLVNLKLFILEKFNLVHILRVGQTWSNLVKLGQTCLNLYYLVRVITDVAATWFDSLPVGSVNTWEELVEAFMNRFSLQLSLLREEEKSLCLSKGMMRVSTQHGRGSRDC